MELGLDRLQHKGAEKENLSCFISSKQRIDEVRHTSMHLSTIKLVRTVGKFTFWTISVLSTKII